MNTNQSSPYDNMSMDISAFKAISVQKTAGKVILQPTGNGVRATYDEGVTWYRLTKDLGLKGHMSPPYSRTLGDGAVQQSMNGEFWASEHELKVQTPVRTAAFDPMEVTQVTKVQPKVESWPFATTNAVPTVSMGRSFGKQALSEKFAMAMAAHVAKVDEGLHEAAQVRAGIQNQRQYTKDALKEHIINHTVGPLFAVGNRVGKSVAFKEFAKAQALMDELTYYGKEDLRQFGPGRVIRVRQPGVTLPGFWGDLAVRAHGTEYVPGLKLQVKKLQAEVDRLKKSQRRASRLVMKLQGPKPLRVKGQPEVLRTPRSDILQFMGQRVNGRFPWDKAHLELNGGRTLTLWLPGNHQLTLKPKVTAWTQHEVALEIQDAMARPEFPTGDSYWFSQQNVRFGGFWYRKNNCYGPTDSPSSYMWVNFSMDHNQFLELLERFVQVSERGSTTSVEIDHQLNEPAIRLALVHYVRSVIKGRTTGQPVDSVHTHPMSLVGLHRLEEAARCGIHFEQMYLRSRS